MSADPVETWFWRLPPWLKQVLPETPHGRTLLLAGLLAVGVGLFGVFRDWEFRGKLSHTTGVAGSNMFDRLGHRRGGWFGHYVHYSYCVGGHTWEDDGVSVDSNTWSKIQMIHEVPIKYLPGSPGVSRIDFDSEEQQLEFQHWLTIAIGGMLLLLVPGFHRHWHAEPPSSEW